MIKRRRTLAPRWRLYAAALLLAWVPGRGLAPLHAEDPPKQRPAVGSGIPPGYMIIEGDILVPLDFYTSRATYMTNLWPGGDVPFLFSTNVNQANQTAMLNAMALWEAVATVDFRPLNGDPNWVFIQNSNANNSMIGMVGGAQVINISSWGSPFIIAHELAHALGYWHEQSRADRNSFIQVNYGNICQNCCPGGVPCDYNFDIRTSGGEYGPYDFDSVMHYGQCAFSACGNNCTVNPATCCQNNLATCRTITVLPPNQAWQTLIGQSTRLSVMDQLTMSFLYPESDWRFVDVQHAGWPAQYGSFVFPWATFQQGAALTPLDGTLWVQPGNYSAVGTYNRRMTIKAPLGAVSLGN